MDGRSFPSLTLEKVNPILVLVSMGCGGVEIRRAVG
jgi:hypothetical protein